MDKGKGFLGWKIFVRDDLLGVVRWIARAIREWPYTLGIVIFFFGIVVALASRCWLGFISGVFLSFYAVRDLVKEGEIKRLRLDIIEKDAAIHLLVRKLPDDECGRAFYEAQQVRRNIESRDPKIPRLLGD